MKLRALEFIGSADTGGEDQRQDDIFEATDAVAAALIAAKRAVEHVEAAAAPVAEAPKGKTTQARVLTDCVHGKVNDVVNLSAAELKQAEAAGQVDSDKAAVKYANSLKAAKAEQ